MPHQSPIGATDTIQSLIARPHLCTMTDLALPCTLSFAFSSVVSCLVSCLVFLLCFFALSSALVVCHVVVSCLSSCLDFLPCSFALSSCRDLSFVACRLVLTSCRALALTSCRVVVLGRFASGDDFRLETGSLWTRQNDHTSHSQAYVFLAVGYIWDPM
jgi:hypothetical protein